MSPAILESVDRIRKGDVRTAARLMRDLDDGLPESREILRQLFSNRSHAYVLGITGPPGVGKSTLIDRLIDTYRKQGHKIGGLMVDPTSPYTGGAILGDRIRMQRHSTDEGVFLRSLATRGHLGGLSRSALDILTVMESMGKDVILMETVGIGQAEVEIAEVAHTTLVVLAPGLGDGIQAIKAGILEIADLFVINKADRDGVEQTQTDLQTLIEMEGSRQGWTRPILTTTASEGEGTDELVAAIQRHRHHLESSGRFEEKMKRRALRELLSALHATVDLNVVQKLKDSGRLEPLLREITTRAKDPYTLAESLIREEMK